MKKKRNMDRFLQQVENLVTAASLTAEELRESGFGYMAARLEKFGVKLDRGVVRDVNGAPLTTWEQADEMFGEKGEVVRVLL